MQKIMQDISIGTNLKRLRKAKDYSQNDVVIQLHLLGRSMTRANYAHIEQGVRNIYVSDLILLQQIFNVSFDEFFKDLAI